MPRPVLVALVAALGIHLAPPCMALPASHAPPAPAGIGRQSANRRLSLDFRWGSTRHLRGGDGAAAAPPAPPPLPHKVGGDLLSGGALQVLAAVFWGSLAPCLFAPQWMVNNVLRMPGQLVWVYPTGIALSGVESVAVKMAGMLFLIGSVVFGMTRAGLPMLDAQGAAYLISGLCTLKFIFVDRDMARGKEIFTIASLWPLSACLGVLSYVCFTHGAGTLDGDATRTVVAAVNVLFGLFHTISPSKIISTWTDQDPEGLVTGRSIYFTNLIGVLLIQHGLYLRWYNARYPARSLMSVYFVWAASEVRLVATKAWDKLGQPDGNDAYLRLAVSCVLTELSRKLLPMSDA